MEKVQCDICKASISGDEIEACGCGRLVCGACSRYDTENGTGKTVFECCDVCEKVDCD